MTTRISVAVSAVVLCASLLGCGPEGLDEPGPVEREVSATPEEPLGAAEQELGARCGLSKTRSTAYWRNCTRRCQRIQLDRIWCEDLTVIVPAWETKVVGSAYGICSVRSAKVASGC